MSDGKFEQSRPDHQIHHMSIHRSGQHGQMDQKLHKGNRSPMASQLPMENSLESPMNESGAPQGQDGFGGSQ